MRSFLYVLRFELKNYMENKAYLFTTIIFTVLLVLGLCVPVFFPGVIPGTGNQKEEQALQESEAEISAEKENTEKKRFLIWDPHGVFEDAAEQLTEYMDGYEWSAVFEEEELKNAVKSGEVKAGIALISDYQYQYYVKNSSLMDRDQRRFEEAALYLMRKTMLEEIGVSQEQVDDIYEKEFSSETIALVKDGAGNYFYVYILLFLLYMMILLYGQMIATNVTTEKSSRTMEILVTSTSTDSLLFGKVIAGSIASFFQTGLLLAASVGTYALTRGAWNGMLDIIFQIPGNVLCAFGIFGVLGYIFYSFLYGILGALVSKTEDIGKVSGPVTMIFVIVFLVTIYSLGYSDSIWMKIMSFLPISASNAMVARIALGTVSGVEIVLSILLLIAGIFLAGFAGSRIYRRATLMYGNPIKLSSAFKWLKEN